MTWSFDDHGSVIQRRNLSAKQFWEIILCNANIGVRFLGVTTRFSRDLKNDLQKFGLTHDRARTSLIYQNSRSLIPVFACSFRYLTFVLKDCIYEATAFAAASATVCMLNYCPKVVCVSVSSFKPMHSRSSTLNISINHHSHSNKRHWDPRYGIGLIQSRKIYQRLLLSTWRKILMTSLSSYPLQKQTSCWNTRTHDWRRLNNIYQVIRWWHFCRVTQCQSVLHHLAWNFGDLDTLPPPEIMTLLNQVLQARCCHSHRL